MCILFYYIVTFFIALLKEDLTIIEMVLDQQKCEWAKANDKCWFSMFGPALGWGLNRQSARTKARVRPTSAIWAVIPKGPINPAPGTTDTAEA